MGTCGIGLFQNDIAGDLKHVYIDKLKIGKTDEEAYRETIEELKEYYQDEDDAIDFWLGLASIMYEYGRLTDEVKTKALNIIEFSEDLKRWDTRDREKRKAKLLALKDRLCSEQPQRKHVPLAKRKFPSVKPNDVWCLKLKGDNPYYLLILVDSWIQYDLRVESLGDECPIVYVKVASFIPENVEDVDNMPFFCANPYVWKEIDSCEKRVLIEFPWRNKIKDRMEYLGNYCFTRAEECEDKTISLMAIKSNEIPSYEWNTLEKKTLDSLFIPKSKMRIAMKI